MVDEVGVDGIYIDDTALSAQSLRRARRILDKKSGRLIDFHTGNHFWGPAGYASCMAMYMELLPYVDRLWVGEGFNCNHASLDYWLVEMSGLPFGLMSEMLHGANPWRGLVFGETARKGWSGAGDPTGIWKVWDEFGIQGCEFIPFFVEDNPVSSNSDDVPVTVYRRDGRTFLAIASWAKAHKDIRLTVDWKAIGLDPSRAAFYAPPIEGVQREAIWKVGDLIPVSPGRGVFLVVDEVARKVVTPDDIASVLVETFRDNFESPVLIDGWSVFKSSKADVDVHSHSNAFRITAPANVHGGIERKLPASVRSVQVELDAGTDGGQTWGPGIAMVWPNGHSAGMNLRLEDMNYQIYGGDGTRLIGGPIDRQRRITVRIIIDEQHVYFQEKKALAWQTIGMQSRTGLAGDPVLLRLGKMDEQGGWNDFGGVQGLRGQSAYRDLRIYMK